MKYAILLVSAFILGSCAGVHRTAYHQKYAQTPIIQTPLMAEVEADPTKKVSATFVYQGGGKEYLTSRHFAKRTGMGTMQFRAMMAKEGALYGAMEQNGCDVILQPVYQVKFDGSTIEASVKGVCGTYKNLRKPNLEDVTLLQELKEAMPMFDPEIKEVGIWGKEVRK